MLILRKIFSKPIFPNVYLSPFYFLFRYLKKIVAQKNENINWGSGFIGNLC